MRRITAVTFDLWDTLIQELPGGSDTVAGIRVRKIGSVLSAAGLSHTPREIMEAHEKTGHFLRLIWSKKRDVPVGDQVLFMLNSLDGRLPGRLGKDDLERIEKAYSESLFEKPPILLPGAREVLRDVKESGYRMGLISNTGKTPGSALRVVMDRLGILEFFDTTTFSNEILMRKPSEGAFRMTLEMLKSAPKAAVHIGDDPESDMAGAKRAGLRTIQVLADGNERSPNADFAVASLAEVPETVKRL